MSLDPSVELGDGVNIGGIYSLIGQMDVKLDKEFVATLTCPGEAEIDHEYPYQSAQERELKRRVKLGESYFGTRISRKDGLVIERTDGETVTAKAVLNAEELSFYDGTGGRVLFFDPATGTYKFMGELNVADNFIVDKQGNVIMKGSVKIDGSLNMTGNSNWLLTRYSANKNAPVPDGWAEAWDASWSNTSTQVWVIYSYNGGKDWTQPMLAQGKDGEKGATGATGSTANIPEWVKAYTASAEFDTLVTDEWVVTMNLLSSKIFGGDYFSQDGGGHFKVEDSGLFANFRLFDNDYMSGRFPVISLGTAKRGASSAALILMYDTEILRILESDRVVRPQGVWDFGDADVKGVTATLA